MNVFRVLAKLSRRLSADLRGATAVEYGLIVALIVIAMVVALIGLANASTGLWNDVADKVTKAR